ncbi:hypothetical protein [Caulobacter sp. 602-1]|uniref:hypothetical protein n=1 Tax=Caulobacter sp. 602-1 TaxID=2492472 RepID=UPI000F62F075|nr:hypothetical protein [Caulobacter sp. 602-1]RRN62199.1 hypothetical protein EIK80_22720 [Caulobacter sp. 602-1]
MNIVTAALLPFWLMMLWRGGRHAFLILAILAPLMNSAAFGHGGAITVPWVASLLFVGTTLISRGAWGHAKTLLRQREFQLICLVPLVNFVVVMLSQIFYEGKIRVLVGEAAFTIGRELMLSLFPQHINQMVYSVAAPLLVCAVFCNLAMARERGEDVEKIALDFFVFYAVSAITIILWERVHQITGIWYWSDMFHSTYSMTAWMQSVNGIARLSGSYPEPSSLAYHLGPLAVMFVWLSYYKSYYYGLLAILAAVIMFISTSTTAYIGIGLVGLSAGLLFLRWCLEGLGSVKEGASERALFSLGAATCIFLILGVVAMQNAAFVEQMLQSLLTKHESSSYQARSYADALGVSAFLDTNGLGVGLGGHLTNSGALLIMSNLGIAGIVLVGSLVIIAAMRVFVDHSASRRLGLSGKNVSTSRLRIPVTAALLTFLVTHSLTAPLFISPLLWVSVGVFLYVSCDIRAAARVATSSKQMSRSRRGVAVAFAENRGL